MSLGVICLIVIFSLISYKLYNRVVSDECDYCPIELLKLEISPDKVRVGQEVTLIDGLCNLTDDNVRVQMYLGAQTVNDGLTTRTVDLLTKINEKGERVTVTDTDEGRLPKVLTPHECIANEPLRGPLPNTLSQGFWVIRVHIVAIGPFGEVQHIDKITNTFEVIP